MKHIVLTGGGTAGHDTPNIAMIPHLKNWDIRFLISVLMKESKKSSSKNWESPIMAFPQVS